MLAAPSKFIKSANPQGAVVAECAAGPGWWIKDGELQSLASSKPEEVRVRIENCVLLVTGAARCCVLHVTGCCLRAAAACCRCRRHSCCSADARCGCCRCCWLLAHPLYPKPARTLPAPLRLLLFFAPPNAACPMLSPCRCSCTCDCCALQEETCELFTVAVYNPAGATEATALSAICQQNLKVAGSDGKGEHSAAPRSAAFATACIFWAVQKLCCCQPYQQQLQQQEGSCRAGVGLPACRLREPACKCCATHVPACLPPSHSPSALPALPSHPPCCSAAGPGC